MLASVKEFGRAITAPLGAPAGTLSTYIEVPFSLGDRQFRPDGLIQITRAGRTWTALVEVKTGRNNLEQAQLEAYSDDARRTSDDVDRKKLKKVSLFSLS